MDEETLTNQANLNKRHLKLLQLRDNTPKTMQTVTSMINKWIDETSTADDTIAPKDSSSTESGVFILNIVCIIPSLTLATLFVVTQIKKLVFTPANKTEVGECYTRTVTSSFWPLSKKWKAFYFKPGEDEVLEIETKRELAAAAQEAWTSDTAERVFELFFAEHKDGVQAIPVAYRKPSKFCLKENESLEISF